MNSKYQFQNHCLYAVYGSVPDYCLYRPGDSYSDEFIDRFTDYQVELILDYLDEIYDLPHIVNNDLRDKLKTIANCMF